MNLDKRLAGASLIDEAARFDRMAPFYDLSIAPVELVIQRRRRQLPAQAHGDVLELGVGTGRSLRLYPLDCRLTGIDPSQRMLDRARRKAVRLGRHVDLRLMSAESLDFPDAAFDTIVSSLVFCSVDDPSRALTEAHRVLRPGGQLLMIEHVRPPGRLGRLFDRMDPWFYQQSCHLNHVRRTMCARPVSKSFQTTDGYTASSTLSRLVAAIERSCSRISLERRRRSPLVYYWPHCERPEFAAKMLSTLLSSSAARALPARHHLGRGPRAIAIVGHYNLDAFERRDRHEVTDEGHGRGSAHELAQNEARALTGAMPTNESLNMRPMVTAGLAKLVELVNSTRR